MVSEGEIREQARKFLTGLEKNQVESVTAKTVRYHLEDKFGLGRDGLKEHATIVKDVSRKWAEDGCPIEADLKKAEKSEKAKREPKKVTPEKPAKKGPAKKAPSKAKKPAVKNAQKKKPAVKKTKRKRDDSSSSSSGSSSSESSSDDSDSSSSSSDSDSSEEAPRAKRSRANDERPVTDFDRVKSLVVAVGLGRPQLWVALKQKSDSERMSALCDILKNHGLPCSPKDITEEIIAKEKAKYLAKKDMDGIDTSNITSANKTTRASRKGPSNATAGSKAAREQDSDDDNSTGLGDLDLDSDD